MKFIRKAEHSAIWYVCEGTMDDYKILRVFFSQSKAEVYLDDLNKLR